MLPVGMMSLSAVLIFTHFVQLPDFINGALMGVAIGLLLTGVISKVRSPYNGGAAGVQVNNTATAVTNVERN